MRLASLVLVAGCGRIGFSPLGGGGDGGDDAAGSPAFARLTAYAHQTCAEHAGRAYCWGDNATGRLGDGTEVSRSMPREVALPAGHLDDFTLGESHGCAVVDAAVYCWGNTFGDTPVAVSLPAPAIAIAGGRDFTCAIADTTYCWGINADGQLGDATTMDRPAPVAVKNLPSPAARIDAGDDHACVQATTGEAYCWGHNDNGVLGIDNPALPNSTTPRLVMTSLHALPLISGWSACATSGTDIACWGRNTEGELGDGSNNDAAVPQGVPGTDGWTSVASGGGPTDHDAACAISPAGVRCWGDGSHGRLGNGSVVGSPVPARVVELPGTAASLALGYDHSCALLADGAVWCWGRGDDGELGDGRGMSSLAPVEVIVPAS